MEEKPRIIVSEGEDNGKFGATREYVKRKLTTRWTNGLPNGV